jgi:hypothetical protein
MFSTKILYVFLLHAPPVLSVLHLIIVMSVASTSWLTTLFWLKLAKDAFCLTVCAVL